jgi:hypothetical protein
MGRGPWIAALITIALLSSAWLAWTWRAMPQLGFYHDDAIYMVTAKSLAEGNGYRIESLPLQPYQTKYPPLYPLVLAAVWRIGPAFPANLPYVMLVAWLGLLAVVLLTRKVLRQAGLSDWESAGLAAFVALSPVAVQFGLLGMSELWFTAITVGKLPGSRTRCTRVVRGIRQPGVSDSVRGTSDGRHHSVDLSLAS